jgi:N-acetylmuramic acid 6-phosphate etherase
MQASTVLMAAMGYALLWQDKPETIPSAIDALLEYWRTTDPGFLAHYIVKEAEWYLHGGHLEYQTDSDLAITILTDTTERSPTFSMHPFENTLDVDGQTPRSLCSLFLPEAAESAEAWNMILGRPPRALAWNHIHGIASYERLLGFDFSARGHGLRLQRSAVATDCSFIIKNQPDGISFDFQGDRHFLDTAGTDALYRHLALKMLLNMHSTLVMGRLGRFEGNVMTWVRPSNNKLVDRTIRYADFLLKKKGIVKTYEQLAYACFELQESVAADQSLVHALVRHFI